MNFLNDSRRFFDLETASSSHVPSHLVIDASLCGMLSRNSFLQLDTRNLYGTYVFEDLLAPNELTAACFGNVRSFLDVYCELVFLNTGRPAAEEEELERHIFNVAKLPPRLVRKF